MRNLAAIVSIVSVVGLAVACGGDEDDTSGTGGTSSGGGTASGGASSGGRTSTGGASSGGAPSTGGVTGTGGAASVDGSSDYVPTDIPGVNQVYAYSDVRSTHDLRAGDAPATVCSSGHISMVMNDTEWSFIYGAGFGFSYVTVGATEGVVVPFDATDLHTVKVTLAGAPQGGVRVSLVMTDQKQFYVIGGDGMPVSYTDGEVEISVADLDVPNWIPPEGAEGHYSKADLDLTQLGAVQIAFPANNVAEYDYDLCASDPQLLDESGNTLVETSGGAGGMGGAGGAGGMGGADGMGGAGGAGS